jgi:hypothetical protein
VGLGNYAAIAALAKRIFRAAILLQFSARLPMVTTDFGGRSNSSRMAARTWIKEQKVEVSNGAAPLYGVP